MPYVERDGVRVWFEEHGRGAAALLTHGYGATSRMWEPQWQGLGDRFRLIAWDLRGHGRSDAPEDASLYSEYMAAKIPGARRVVLPNAGHAANLDQPQGFNAAVASFVESVPA